MARETIIKKTVKKLDHLSEEKLKEVEDFVDKLLRKTDDKLLTEGIHKLTSDSKSFEYLKDEEDIYTVNDLKEKYKWKKATLFWFLFHLLIYREIKTARHLYWLIHPRMLLFVLQMHCFINETLKQVQGDAHL